MTRGAEYTRACRCMMAGCRARALLRAVVRLLGSPRSGGALSGGALTRARRSSAWLPTTVLLPLYA